MAKDFLGNELKVGDEVVFVQIGYRKLLKGRIKSLSDKKATIRHRPTNTCKTQSSQFHNQLIKVIKND